MPNKHQTMKWWQRPGVQRKARLALRVASEAYAISLTRGGGTLTRAAAICMGVRLVDTLWGELRGKRDRYIQASWMAETFHELLAPVPTAGEMADDGYRPIELDGLLLWEERNATCSVLRSSDPDRGYRILRSKLWADYGERLRLDYASGDSWVRPHGTEIHITAQSTQLAERIEPLLSAGVAQTVLLHGPPGSGKSSLAAAVVQALGLRCLHVTYKAADTNAVAATLKFLGSCAVVVDDVDRVHNHEHMIATIDDLDRGTAPVVFLTCNWLERLDPALIRRCDHLLEVDGIGADVLAALTKDFDDAERELVAHLPLSYLRQYRDYRSAIGKSAIAYIAELVVKHREVSTTWKARQEHRNEKWTIDET